MSRKKLKNVRLLVLTSRVLMSQIKLIINME